MAAAKVSEAVVGLEPGTKSNPLLPLTVVAKRIGKSVKTVRRLLVRRQFPGVQWAGGRLVIPEQDLLAYIRRERARPVTLLRS